MSSSRVFTRVLMVVPSTLHFIAMCTLTIFHSTLYIALGFLPYEKHYRIAQRWGRDNIIAARWLCGIRLRIEGKENIPDSPVIVFSKHQSSYEIMALMGYLRPSAWVGKQELLKIPVFGWAFKKSKPITIDRTAGRVAVEQLLEQGKQALEEGRNVLIFPEGTRKAPGATPNYRIGGAVLAEQSGYPVLPVALNAGELWPRVSLLKWPGVVTISFGPLIESQGKTAEQIRAEARQWIETKMSEISNPANWNR